MHCTHFKGFDHVPLFLYIYRNIRAVIVKPHSMLYIRLEYFIEQGIQDRKHGWSILPNLRPLLRELVNGISQTAISGSIEWNIQWKSHEHHLFTRPSKNIHLKSENKESLEFKIPHLWDAVRAQLWWVHTAAFLHFSTFYKIMMSPSHSRGHFLHPSPISEIKPHVRRRQALLVSNWINYRHFVAHFIPSHKDASLL